MNIDEAKDILQVFVDIYEYGKGFGEKNSKFEAIHDEYVATKTLLDHCKTLEKEVTQLAIESIEREKLLARLEAEIMAVINHKEM